MTEEKSIRDLRAAEVHDYHPGRPPAPKCRKPYGVLITYTPPKYRKRGSVASMKAYAWCKWYRTTTARAQAFIALRQRYDGKFGWSVTEVNK